MHVGDVGEAVKVGLNLDFGSHLKSAISSAFAVMASGAELTHVGVDHTGLTKLLSGLASAVRGAAEVSNGAFLMARATCSSRFAGLAEHSLVC